MFPNQNKYLVFQEYYTNLPILPKNPGRVSLKILITQINYSSVAQS